MNLNKFAQEVHQNAVNHGWWETEREITETTALIHSEWSEALEEYRADRPMHYYNVGSFCESCSDRPVMMREICEADHCEDNKKPEGIAVELIDGCIRILDLFGQYGRKCSSTTIQELKNRIHANNPTLAKDTPLPTLVCALHSLTAKAGDRGFALTNKAQAIAPLEAALGVVFFWVAENGLDPEKLMLEKHEYNKSRPYKHGKKC